MIGRFRSSERFSLVGATAPCRRTSPYGVLVHWSRCSWSLSRSRAEYHRFQFSGRCRGSRSCTIPHRLERTASASFILLNAFLTTIALLATPLSTKNVSRFSP
jgi:hypothetical protein